MGYYPDRWEDLIGQEMAKEHLRTAARAAAARRGTMRHTLITSPISGVGKSAIARLVAAELGGRLLIQTDPLKGAAIRMLFLKMKPGDVLFLDEVHRQFGGGKKNAEWLLELLDNGVFPGVRGPQQAPPSTIIAATTDVGVLSPPFLTRFSLQVELESYTDDEGAEIAGKLAEKILGVDGLAVPSPSVRAAIARGASNIPRDMSRILEELRDLVWGRRLTEGREDGNYPIEDALRLAGFTPDGLSRRQVRYLTTLLSEWSGEPAGGQVLANRLGEVPAGLAMLENQLAKKGLLLSTKSGRTLSDAGILRAEELLAA